MNVKNYYDILGLNKDVTQEEIKAAFRKLSIKFHPDKNNGDEFLSEMFKNINEANETLSSIEKRRIYDNSFFKKSDNDYTNNYSQNNFGSSFRIKELTTIYWEKYEISNITQDNYWLAEKVRRPKYITIPNVLWTVIILIVSYIVLEPDFDANIKHNGHEYITIRKSNIYIRPDKDSEVIGEIDNYKFLNELSKTKYFLKIEFTDNSGERRNGFIRKSNVKKK